MGNYADKELLYCDEKLDMGDSFDEMDVTDEYQTNYWKDAKNTLKPRHLLFDGLEMEYASFDMFEKHINAERCIGMYVTSNERLAINSARDEVKDIIFSHHDRPIPDPMRDVLNDPNIISVSVKKYKHPWTEDEINGLDHDDGTDSFESDLEMQWVQLPLFDFHNEKWCEECIQDNIDEYCNNQGDEIIRETDGFAVNVNDYENNANTNDNIQEGSYSLPERDEMNDLQEKMDSLDL